MALLRREVLQGLSRARRDVEESLGGPGYPYYCRSPGPFSSPIYFCYSIIPLLLVISIRAVDNRIIGDVGVVAYFS